MNPPGSQVSLTWAVPVAGDSVTATYGPSASDEERAVFVFAHGAGGHMYDRGMQQTSDVLRANGIATVRFNFPYREKNSGRPDPMPKLKETIAAVVAHARKDLGPKLLLIGGRSMGGRAASMLAADDFDSDGLLLLAYPLHPAGKPDQLRDAHLPSIAMPVLCFNGTRDSLCARELMEHALQTVKTDWEMRWVQGADHSFHVLKSSGRTDSEVSSEIGNATSEWIERTFR